MCDWICNLLFIFHFYICRLLKNSIKLSNSNVGSLSRSRGFSRRINVNLPASPHNFNKCSTTQDKENMGHAGGGIPAPEIDDLPFSQHSSSPPKQISSPSKVRIKTFTFLWSSSTGSSLIVLWISTFQLRKDVGNVVVFSYKEKVSFL
jgi:hypothetical protein